MKKYLKFLPAFCLTLLLIVACGQFFSTPIDKILENPRDYAGKEITISGTVTEAYSLVFVKYFILKDDTGEIPVVTQKPMPRKGSKLKVKGFVREAFSIGDQQLIVVEEK